MRLATEPTIVRLPASVAARAVASQASSGSASFGIHSPARMTNGTLGIDRGRLERRLPREARLAQVLGEHHHAEQEPEGVAVDRPPRLVRGEHARRDHEHRAEEGRRRPVHGEERKAAARDGDVGEGEDDDGGGHASSLVPSTRSRGEQARAEVGRTTSAQRSRTFSYGEQRKRGVRPRSAETARRR